MAWLARLCSKINIFLYFEADRFTKIRSSLGWNMYFDVIESNFTILFSSQNKPHNCWKISEKVYHCATQYIFLSCCWAGRTGQAIGGHVIPPDFGRFGSKNRSIYLSLLSLCGFYVDLSMETRCNCESLKLIVFFIIFWYFMNTRTDTKILE